MKKFVINSATYLDKYYPIKTYCPTLYAGDSDPCSSKVTLLQVDLKTIQWDFSKIQVGLFIKQVNIIPPSGSIDINILLLESNGKNIFQLDSSILKLSLSEITYSGYVYDSLNKYIYFDITRFFNCMNLRNSLTLGIYSPNSCIAFDGTRSIHPPILLFNDCCQQQFCPPSTPCPPICPPECIPGPCGPIGSTGTTGATGPTGSDGLTPSIGTNGNWIIGATDTGVSANGLTGATGFTGSDGLTPNIGTNGNWIIGATDTGVSANGLTGATGISGLDGLTPNIGTNGNWIIGATDTGISAIGVTGATGSSDGVNDCCLESIKAALSTVVGQTLSIGFKNIFSGTTVVGVLKCVNDYVLVLDVGAEYEVYPLCEVVGAITPTLVTIADGCNIENPCKCANSIKKILCGIQSNTILGISINVLGNSMNLNNIDIKAVGRDYVTAEDSGVTNPKHYIISLCAITRIHDIPFSYTQFCL